MDISLSLAKVRSAVYGNPMLDASKGYKSVIDQVKDSYNYIFYFDDSKKNNTKRISSIDKSVLLFNALKKNIPKRVIEDTIKAEINAANDDRRILGVNNIPSGTRIIK